MKRILSCIVLVLAASASVHPIFAQSTPGEQPVEIQTTAVRTETEESQLPRATPPVEYALPYPGILPDHPFFFLKRIRDSVMELLISDPVKKAEFYLLQADKRLSMAISYDGKKDTASVLSMIAQDEAYYKKLLAILDEQTKRSGNIPGYLVSKIQSSLTKHVEVITGLTNRATGTDADRFGSFLKSFGSFSGSVHE